jgi:excinuclease ABC subunit C
MREIKEVLRELPKEPGIYQYFSKDAKLLYIGKAKNLSNRVKSYWLLTPHIHPKYEPTTRIGKMLAEAKYIDHIVVSSEEDALILENSLIKQLKPKYNILLRDDKTYPYIYIDQMQDFPRFEITRKVVKSPKVKYYGPFPTGSKALLDAIYDFFPLVQKKSCIKGNKACLFYEINKCLAPCEGKISKQEYAKIVQEAKHAINNRKILLDKMAERMLKLATQERFEEAAKLRDSIEAIKSLQMKSTIDIATTTNYDIFAISSSNDKGVVVKIFMREGKIVSSAHHIFRNLDKFDQDEAYKQAIIDHYKNIINVDVNKILVAHEFKDRESVAEVVAKITNKKVSITSPKAGNRAKLTDLAIKNATEILKQNSTKDNYSIEKELKELLSLDVEPYRFECFDNSHMMGQATVGAMIVYDNNSFNKSSYRRYELKAKDEYAQMKELLRKRAQSFSKNSPPDLWVIDGGATLLTLAQSILKEYKVNLDVVAIAKEKLNSKAHRAKGAAKDIIYTQYGEIIELKSTDKRLHFLQKLRDEAHRFAISYHKQKKQKEDMNLKLFEHKGVGKQVVKKLLNYFGTFEAIKNASHEEIAKITNKSIANSLKDVKNI